MERTGMSTKELKRWVVMRRIRDRTLSRGEAAALLGLSYRQVKRIFRRFRMRGQKGLIHGNVGQRAYFGEVDHSFRPKAITCFGPCRSASSVDGDHWGERESAGSVSQWTSRWWWWPVEAYEASRR